MRGSSFLLCEAGSALLFFGVLAGNNELISAGRQAQVELEQRGCAAASAAEPLRIYPAPRKTEPEDAFGPAHAGGWRPGVIVLRPEPQGRHPVQVYLRHEMMHEAAHRSCRNRLPLWASEAAAIAFSGELSGEPDPGPVQQPALEHLREFVRTDTQLSPAAYRTLRLLVQQHGWPAEPCAVSSSVAQLVRPDSGLREGGLTYVLINMLTGQVIEREGAEGRDAAPPGSLLKIAYAAALEGGNPGEIGRELAASDTKSLLARLAAFDRTVYRLYAAAADKDLQPLLDSSRHRPEVLLGERQDGGQYPLELPLQNLALILRAALLLHPERFTGLAQNGFAAGTTLFSASEAEKRLLAGMHAAAKTGTASNSSGEPLVGHLMLVWPSEAPLYLAVLRRGGVRGAAVLGSALETIRRWQQEYRPAWGSTRVRLLSTIPPNSREVIEECPAFAVNRYIRPAGDSSKRQYRASVCGSFRITASARGSRSERRVFGLLEHRANNELVLETDPDLLSQEVLQAEGDSLALQASSALRAVVFWNAVHGLNRHPQSHSLCDLTHCMVFLGRPVHGARSFLPPVDRRLINLLDSLAALHGAGWLMFSAGGNEPWARRYSAADLAQKAGEGQVLDIERMRTRSGEVVFTLQYAGGSEETVGCAVLQRALKLPSCPERAAADAPGGGWLFTGRGAGHGRGLSLSEAQELAKSGKSAAEILESAFRSEKADN